MGICRPLARGAGVVIGLIVGACLFEPALGGFFSMLPNGWGDFLAGTAYFVAIAVIVPMSIVGVFYARVACYCFMVDATVSAACSLFATYQAGAGVKVSDAVPDFLHLVLPLYVVAGLLYYASSPPPQLAGLNDDEQSASGPDRWGG